jgi:hypothetical protein
VGGVSFLLILIGVVAFILHQHRRKMRNFIRPSSSGAIMEASSQTSSQMRVTPFNLRSPSAQPPQRPYSLSLLPPLVFGSSGKELARLRAENSGPQQTPANMESSGSQLEPNNVPILTADSQQVATIPPSETRGLRSLVESLQRQVQQLRAERFDAPPSYSDDGA